MTKADVLAYDILNDAIVLAVDAGRRDIAELLFHAQYYLHFLTQSHGRTPVSRTGLFDFPYATTPD